MNFTKKIKTSWLLLKFLIWSYPIRLYRLPKHLLITIYNIWKSKFSLRTIAEDLSCIFLLFADLIAIPEIYEVASMFFKPNVRQLNTREIEITEGLFKQTLPIQLVKVDSTAKFTTKNGKYAYVSFFTINASHSISEKTFAHELIHVWQYTRFGSAYIAKAIFAQHSQDGYDYGGVEKLFERYNEKASFYDFNFEQQGDILADYFELLINEKTILPTLFYQRNVLYNYFVKDILKLKIYRW